MTQLSTAEIEQYREVLPNDASFQSALTQLQQHNGDIDSYLNEILLDKFGATRGYQKSLREVTLKRLRKELCGADDSFRTKVQEYKRNPASAPLLTGLIVSLLGMTGLPLDPTIATVIVLYIVHVGIDIFCEYTEPDADASGNQPPKNQS
ncbi:hypothetical protein HW132_29010 [Brasilonema sp. CT11]|nr:hypothetical protein [Brasilonema sp. CT11]